MKNLTLVIPAKEEPNSLPLVIQELQNYSCKKLVVFKEDDIITFHQHWLSI